MDVGGRTSGGLKRRQVLRAGAGGLLITASIPGCDVLATDPAGVGGAAQKSARKGKEAPVLAQRVKAGDLPSVEERLPVNPLVIETVERPGVYGGTWTSAMNGPSDTATVYRNVGYDQLLTWDRGYTTWLPNVIEEVEVVGGGREYVLHLRAGMSWSDGEPFTADDMAFVYNDVFLNPELYPVPPDYLIAAGEPGVLDQLDETTVRLSFKAPNAEVPFALASPDDNGFAFRPKHFLRDFHVKYNPEVKSLADDEGFSGWTDLFSARADRWQNADLPTLSAWMVTQPLGEGTGTRFTLERNPYYWKTDQEGSQLPYIDRVVFNIVENKETMLLQASRGEYDMIGKHVNILRNKPILAQNRESGGYHFFEKSELPNAMVVIPNLTHRDGALSTAFQNRDFRIGLSHAINRQEIIDAAFQRQGEPWQAAPRPENEEVFDEELAKQYTKYDVELANRYLDEAGYTDRDSDGFRLLPTGDRISFRMTVVPNVDADLPPAVELISDQWSDVGIEMRSESMDSSLFWERLGANEWDWYVWHMGGDGNTALGAMLAPDFYAPVTNHMATLWSNWYMGAEPQERPPEPVVEQMEIFDKLETVLDGDERIDILRQVLEIAKREFYCLGIVKLPAGYGIVGDEFHNVPKVIGEAWTGVNPGRTRPEQYFVAR